MRKIIKIFLVSFIILILSTGISTIIFLVNGNAFREAQNIAPGICKDIVLSEGSAEDIQIDRINRIALLSVMDRRSTVEGKMVQGTIMGYNLDINQSEPLKILSNQPEDFRPHGFNLFTSKEGIQTLFVINHSIKNGELIELFEKKIDEIYYKHIRSFKSELLIKPNDLVAVGSRKFYVANDTGAKNNFERTIEMLFAVGMSPLVYFDGNNFTNQVTNLKSSAGINVNLKSKELYVGETMGKSIRIYHLENDMSLGKLKETIHLDGGVDNIDIDKDDRIWVANHINSVSLIRHFINKESMSPSQIQRIIRGDNQNKIDTLFENDGSMLSAGSVGVRDRDSLLIGSITEKKILRCKLD